MWLQRGPEGLWEDLHNPRLVTGKELPGERESLALEVREQRLDSYVSDGFNALH